MAYFPISVKLVKIVPTKVGLSVVNNDLNLRIIKCMTSCVQTHAENKLQDGPRVLDFGCGTGLSSKWILQNLSNIELSGVDISPKAVAVATRTGLDIRLVRIEDPLPFPDGHFDFVFAVFVMHFRIDSTSIAEIHRVLARDGLFLFNLYNTEPTPLRASLINARFSEPRAISECTFALPNNHHVFVCTKNALSQIWMYR